MGDFVGVQTEGHFPAAVLPLQRVSSPLWMGNRGSLSPKFIDQVGVSDNHPVPDSRLLVEAGGHCMGQKSLGFRV